MHVRSSTGPYLVGFIMVKREARQEARGLFVCPTSSLSSSIMIGLPFAFNGGDSTDEVLAGQYEVSVQDPRGLDVQH